MDGLLPYIQNSSSDPSWVWLGQNIVANAPSTVQVLCLELCAVNALFHVFATARIPWTISHEQVTMPLALANDVVLILADKPSDTKRALAIAAEAFNAYRAQYLLVQNRKVGSKALQGLASYAWSRNLYRTSLAEFEDQSVFVTLPNCHTPLVVRVATLRWTDFKNISVRNCAIRIAVVDLPPFIIFDSNQSSLQGAWLPFFKHAESRLQLRPFLIQTDFYQMHKLMRSGRLDMAVFQFVLKPNMNIQIAGRFSTIVTWCVPNSCTHRKTSPVIWEEVPALMWTFLAASILSVSLAVQLLAPPPGLTFEDSIMRVIATLTSNVIKLPKGHARWPLVGWLLATVVLGTCYQTVLRSLITAPSWVHEIDTLEDLSRSTIQLACMGACLGMKMQAKEHKTMAALVPRVRQFGLDLAALSRHFANREEKAAVLTSSYICDKFYAGRMSPLPDYRLFEMFFGMYGFAPWSWLAPSLHRISAELEASGLGRIWLKTGDGRPSCSSGLWSGPQPITTNHLFPIFVLIGVGLSMALIAFINELLWFRFMQGGNEDILYLPASSSTPPSKMQDKI